MPLRLRLIAESSIPIEVDTVRLETAREQTLKALLTTPVQQGNVQEQLGEFFEATGSASDDDTLVWEGDCSCVKLIATGLSVGTVRVEGNAGMHLGAEMTGGEVLVEGNADDWVGAEMHGGRIHIHGNAGHLVGAVYRGGHRGMTAGEILVHGDAGNEVGHAMRRGLIAIGGRSGDAIGVGLIAGTIVSAGEVGIRHGAGMKRGSIILLSGQSAPEMLPTFRDSGLCQPTFLRIYLRHLASLDWPLPADSLDTLFRRYCGDFLETGKGEILVRSQ